jgi:peptidoglycan hydrolase-like protein with peptidoglycan-binding domain
MGVVSQRFAGNETLRRCVDEGHRMLLGEPDQPAVRKLQRALLDLGYAVAGGDDGAFGQGTADAVVAFKFDEGLEPHDGVASRGTIGRLDEYFRHEPFDPDAPDPSVDGLTDLVEESMGTAVTWISAAIDSLNQFPSDLTDSDDPVWLDREERLQRNFQLSQSRLGREASIDQVLLPVFLEAKRALLPPSIFFTQSETRQSYAISFPGSGYIDLVEHVGGRVTVTPPYRNVLDDDERVCAVIRLGVGLDGRIDLFAVPGTPRFFNLGADGIRDKNAYAGFAYETLHPGQVRLHPRYRWQND